MKKFTAILTAAFMVLTLAACSSENPGSASGETSSAAEATSSTAEATSSAAEATSSAASDTSAEPEESEPEESQTESSNPEESVPEDSTPEETKPVTTATTKPAATTTVTTTPVTTKPETTKPETTKPVTTKPVTTKPVTTTPEESEPGESEPEEENSGISDPVTLLNSVYALFGEDEKFPATGGDFSSGELIEGAGSFALAEPDMLDNVTGFPAAEIASIDSAATLTHMMNQNTFTAGAFHVVSGTDLAALSEAIRANIQNRMWCCGFPEKLIVATVDDHIISAFGKEFAISAFTTHLAEAYPSAVIVIEEDIL
ncbi:MAG: hypothetical protein SPD47_06495 [Oscillospiraceae bacterium]|nr:hypothetical protein [Oscillospiraceae bacterium]